ncbi:MAG: hypothetical protein HUJ29_06590 [Gammaproteobacteria bacterium]|nr:hypothetical protein [Gammaproteobacteria bacterium]
MPERLMLLPCKTFELPVLVSVPEDFGKEEAFRHVTGLIAQVEEDDPAAFARDDIVDILEQHGFTEVVYEMGPVLD